MPSNKITRTLLKFKNSSLIKNSSRSFHTCLKQSIVTGDNVANIDTSAFGIEDARTVFESVAKGDFRKLAEIKKKREGKELHGEKALKLAEEGDYKGLIALKQKFDVNDVLEIDDLSMFIVAFGKLRNVHDAELLFKQYLKKKANTDREVIALRNALLYTYLINDQEDAAQNFFIDYFPVVPSITTYKIMNSHQWKQTPVKYQEHLKKSFGLENPKGDALPVLQYFDE
ncbi:hypothetical protein ABK040_005278 [Willaertia magna]